MAIATTTMKNALAGEYATTGTWISLHTGDPSTTGANEASGGSYARKQTTWGTASSGAVTGSQVTIDVAAGTYTHVGLFSAETSGNFLDSYALADSITMSAVGQIKVTPTFTQS